MANKSSLTSLLRPPHAFWIWGRTLICCPFVSSGMRGNESVAQNRIVLTHFLTDVAAQLPSTSNVQPSLVCVSQALTHAWTSLCRGGTFGRLLDTTWGVESILSIFNSSLPLLRARLMALPKLPWCFGDPGRSTRETILAIEDQVEPFQTPTVPVLSTSCVPSNPAHYKKKSVSHPTYWRSNRKKKNNVKIVASSVVS